MQKIPGPDLGTNSVGALVDKAENIAIYNKNTIKHFSSFGEMNEADAKERANISPEQHLINTTQRIKNMYADELGLAMDKTLKFKKDE